MPENKNSEVYFRNLDGLRFLASVFVIVGHCQKLLYDTIGVDRYFPYVNKLATFGVDFFFVLSGFLITFLLLKELERDKNLNVRKFYIRRILRLWPLYFGVGILSLVFGTPLAKLVGYPDFPQPLSMLLENLGYLFTFSINFQNLLGTANPYSSAFVSHFWSLGIEEQFYLLFAPLVLWSFKKWRIEYLFLTFIVVGFSLNCLKFSNEYFAYNFTINRLYNFGLGAMLSWLFSKGYLQRFNTGPKWESWALQVSFLVPVCLFLFGKHFYPAHELNTFGFISAALIVLAISKNSIFPFEYKWLKYLGKVSFGIYVFHLFMVRLSLKLLQNAGYSADSEAFIWLFPTLSSVLAIGTAVLSFEFFEKPFLNLKNKFR
jgi:peptidoglycan/LPS O-acetylase OafA/YrhL